MTKLDSKIKAAWIARLRDPKLQQHFGEFVMHRDAENQFDCACAVGHLIAIVPDLRVRFNQRNGIVQAIDDLISWKHRLHIVQLNARFKWSLVRIADFVEREL